MANAAGTIKRLQLELGGKSAQVVLDDCPESYAASIGFGTVLGHCGQICVNQSRLLLPQHLLDAYLAGVERAKERVRVGDTRDPATTLGPLVSHEQRQRVEHFVKAGIDEGARLVAGGKRPDGIDRGYFYEPTVFVAKNDMTIAREEVFGPVLTVIPYEGGDSEAVRLANDSPYGLGGGVIAATTARAFDAARRIRTGMVMAVGLTDGPGAALPATPGQGPGWGLPVRSRIVGHHAVNGGFKQSGIGREMGDHGVEIYTELKAISWT
jgi:aldehyde dehydrogenase (NAD+)